MAAKPETADRPYLSLVLPAYNEEQRLGASLRKLADHLGRQGYACEILVVDDGSSDATADVAERWAASMPDTVSLRVLTHLRNQGKGAAVKTGCLAATGDYVLYTDVDLASPLDDCERIVAALHDDADVAIGTRVHPGGHDMRSSQPWTRRLLGRLFTFFRKRLLLPDIEDTQCPLKGFRREAARRIFAAQRLSSWSFDVEVLYLARRFGMKTAQIPVRWEHVEGSTLRVRPQVALRVFWDLLRLRFLHRRVNAKGQVG
ncbi:MAG: dolichyl-phosphate beta-glucosyltransferase [Dehalococcoidia bacterium]|jgi:dolichyl-phosphate beta-glucosyltransferase